MTVWIRGDVRLTAPFTLNDPTLNLVIEGKVESEHDITIRIKHLIIHGEFICKKTFSVEQGSTVYVLAGLPFTCKKLDLTGAIFNIGLHPSIIEKAQAIGITITKNAEGKLELTESVPQSSI